MNEEKKRPEDAEEAKKETREQASEEKPAQDTEKDPFRVRTLHAENDESGGH